MAEPISTSRLDEANLERERPLASSATLDGITVNRVLVDSPASGHRVHCLRAEPPDESERRGNVLLLHDQTNTSTIWEELGTMKVLSASGYTCVAPDLPATGQTGGPATEDSPSRLEFVQSLLIELDWTEVILIGASMAGQFIIPLLNSGLSDSDFNRKTKFRISSLVAIALSDTNQLDPCAAKRLTIVTLVLRGELDTSLGLSAAENLKPLPNATVLIVPEGRHLCHKSHPDYFHRALLNFLDGRPSANKAGE